MHGGHQGRERIPRNFGPPTDDEPFRYEPSAVDLVDEDDDHLDKHALNDGHVLEAVYGRLHRGAAG